MAEFDMGVCWRLNHVVRHPEESLDGSMLVDCRGMSSYVRELAVVNGVYTILVMECRRVSWAMIALVGVMLVTPGCLAVATAPIRMAQREKAQEGFDRIADRTPEQIAAFIDQRLANGLALTEEEKPKVAVLDLDYARKLRAIAASDDGVRAKGRAMKKENETHEAALKAVLTPEQFTRFTAMQEELRDALRSAAAK